MSDLPAYVIDGNLYDALAAVQLTEVVMHNFCIPADPAKLQVWLDKTFEVPSGGKVRYQVLGDKVFLGFAEIGKLRTEEVPSKGYTSEIDITIWILAHRIDGGLFNLRWIPAYLFVDSGPALVSGREVWGFPKQLGRFHFSPQTKDPGAARTWDAEGWVVSPFGPDSPARWAMMFQARPKAPVAPPQRSGVLKSLEALAEATGRRLTGDFVTAAGRLRDAISAGGMTMAFLKQFPDCATPASACYQAVVEADATITGYRGSGLTDDEYEVRITTFDSHPYLSELGISTDWQSVGQGFWMDFDFEQKLGRAVWSAGAGA